jgi:hypothetical protein
LGLLSYPPANWFPDSVPRSEPNINNAVDRINGIEEGYAVLSAIAYDF